MTSQFPMLCDSCIHKLPNQFRCTAYPDGIELRAVKAEVHYSRRPDQDNDIVYQQADGTEDEREAFDKLRASYIARQPAKQRHAAIVEERKARGVGLFQDTAADGK